MKIAIFHELDYGGARRAVNDLAKEIKKNHLVDLYFVGEEDYKDEARFFTKVFFYKFIPKKWIGKDWMTRLYKDTVELYKLYRLHKKIARFINSKKYDLVFVHPSKYTQAPFILRSLKKKTVYYCQEPLRIAYDPQLASVDTIPIFKREYERLNRIIRKYMDKKNVSCAHHILVNSKYTQNAVKNAYGRESILCYLGVDVNVFKPLEIKKVYDVLFIGNKDERSGYKLFSDAISLIEPEPKIRIKLRTSFDMDDVNLVKLYNRSRMVVVLTQNEPFGLIPLEAMACAVPVIAVNEGGYKETVIDTKTGYLINRDSKELADAIEKLLGNPRMASKLGLNGKRTIFQYWSTEKKAKDFLKIFNQIAQA
ncbi:MAG: glycosyltransferase family 4 protein [Patescibacteria group bacterium]